MTFISVLLEDESGDRKATWVGVPFPFPSHSDIRFSALRFIDPYGDTIFNRVQMPSVLADLEILLNETSNPESINHLHR